MTSVDPSESSAAPTHATSEPVAVGRVTYRAVVMGTAGSGKSLIGELLAQRLDLPFADADDFHPAANVAKMAAGHSLTDEDCAPWLQALAGELAKAEARGQSYRLPAGAFFAIKNGQIAQVTTYYNLADWIRQIS